MDPVTLTTSDLLTVAGAGAAALVLATFAKKLFSLGRGWTRIVALVAGLVVVLAAYISQAAGFNAVEILLATVVGAQAGLAASAGFDSVDAGFGYEVYEAGAHSDEAVW